MYRIVGLVSLILFQSIFVNAQNIPTGITSPASRVAIQTPDYLFMGDTPRNFLRTFAVTKPITDTSLVGMSSLVEDVKTSTTYSDGFGKTIQSVQKQASPSKNDNVALVWYDEFNRTPIQYLPYVSPSNTGLYKFNGYSEDSTFYKGLFSNEQIIYSKTTYDKSPLNFITKVEAHGNNWAGAGVGRSTIKRANTISDSVVFWTIPIVSEDDIPTKTAICLAGTLKVIESIDERGIKSVKYVNNLGQTVLSKVQIATSPSTGHAGWLCTYYVFDEIGKLRFVIPPKAVDALNKSTVNWNLGTNPTISTNLCFAYFYDIDGRTIMQRIPGSGKIYAAYDLYNRPVMSQDPKLRLTNQWLFTLYDGQSRVIKAGLITTSLNKDSVIAQASRSTAYPTLSGTYTITSELFYDDYNWIAGSGTTLTSALDASNINASNFNTNYNSSPLYPQQIASNLRVRGTTTGTKTLILNSSTFLYSVNLYDDNGRGIQTKQTNYSGGTDVTTIQYGFTGTILRTHIAHQKSGANAQTHTLLTKFDYDHMGRLKQVFKNIDNLGDKMITQNTFNELGKLISHNMGNGVEVQSFNYNIRGWLTGINSAYVTTPGSTSKYFGETISYDIGFTNPQINGNIAGVQWKAGGDNIARAYGFSYDNANRLLTAEFNQQNSGSTTWTKDKVDYTADNLSYDASGNIITMRQKGLKVGTSTTIDSLAYQYFVNSNQLQKVSDGIADASPLGDFKDTSLVVDDYTYDANGNIIKDNNRKMHTVANGPGAVFNFMNKPDSIAIGGKTGTYYYYDASGKLLRKQINSYTGANQAVRNFLYVGSFVYMNDTLQYVLTEEGKIRYAKKKNSVTGANYYAFEYDYYLKDHLGNIRTVLTEGRDTSTYMATMEPANSTVENALFANEYSPVNTTANKPAGFDTDGANTKVVKLNANVTNLRTGPSLVLKVMAGDKVQMNTFAFYNTATHPPVTGINLLSEVLNTLTSSVITNSSGKLEQANNSALSTALSPNVTNFLNNNRPFDNLRPKAYLNWILFDEQFQLVASNSGVQQVVSGATKQALVAPLQTIVKNGFLYVYVSNESPQDVFFDDITIKHFTGPLQQEQSFYPFGLQMAGISSKALLKATDPYKYNGGVELEEESNYYNTFYRKYDPQIGRFTGVDSRSGENSGMSVYHFGANNPISVNDPLGDINKYVDHNGNSWHGPDPFAGTSLEGIQITSENWSEVGFFSDNEGGGSGNTSGNPNNDFDHDEIEKQFRALVEKKDYSGAYRFIASAYGMAGSLVEGVDYGLNPVVGESTSDNTAGAFSTDENVFGLIKGTPHGKPFTNLSTQPFMNYLKGGQSFGATVRQIFHEFIHIKLYYGMIAGFEKLPIRSVSNRPMQETIATYFELTNKSLPPYKKNSMEACSKAEKYGLYYYDQIYDNIWKKRLKYMSDYFLTLIK